MLLSKTYETWDEEDLEHGDTDKKGFVFQDENYSFKDLLDELKDEYYLDLNCSNINHSDSISYCGDLDYISGDKQVLTLHFNGTDRQKKYWIKALKIHLEIKD